MPAKKQPTLGSVFEKLLDVVAEAKTISDAQSQKMVGSKIADVTDPAQIEQLITEYRATDEHKVYEALRSTADVLRAYGASSSGGVKKTVAVA